MKRDDPNTHVTLAHGNGGRRMREWLENVLAHHLDNPGLDTGRDAALLGHSPEELAFTTDGFIVQPLEFPGGNIGSLCVNGTANDLAVAGARPRFLSLSLFIEEGMAMDRLERILASIGQTARQHDIQVVTGDTKVLPRGQGSGLHVATSGIGHRLESAPELDLRHAEVGDRLIVSGPVGDHGAAVMLAREEFGLSGTLASDCACVWPLCEAALSEDGLRFMRDPTRGGLATVAHELAADLGATIRLWEADIPVRDPVRGVCDILGFDPFFLACEGRVVALAPPAAADRILDHWHALPDGKDAAVIGEITQGPNRVVLQTALGGERILPELEEEALPRIC